MAAKSKVIPRTLSAHAPSVRPLHHGLRQCRSVQLRASDRRLNTFITSFGHWHYTRAPQGFLSFGDGYNRRFDAILSDFERKERCVDDTIHYDTDLEHHWWRTIDFLTRVGRSGIVLNPDKFQFAERSVDFAGFRVSLPLSPDRYQKLVWPCQPGGELRPVARHYGTIQAIPQPTLQILMVP